MKTLKKNLFTVGLAFSMILGVAFSFVPQEAKANDNMSSEINNGNISCTCTSIVRGRKCKANASGADCAPTGSSMCWEYDRNC